MGVRRSGVGYADFSGGDANHIIGCTPVSAGCANCYARELIHGRQGRDFTRVRIYPEKLRRLRAVRLEEKGTPFRRGPGSRPVVFPVDLGDHFHEDVPRLYIQEALDVYAAREDADWLILTKRSARMVEVVREWLETRERQKLPSNIWPGVTVESSEYLWRARELLAIPAAVHWISAEPLLGSLDHYRLAEYVFDHPLARMVAHREWTGHGWRDREDGACECIDCGRVYQIGDPHINWIVLGAESGPNRRPFRLSWARDIRDLCFVGRDVRRDIRCAFFYKQGSHRFPGREDTLDGRQYKEYPNVV